MTRREFRFSDVESILRDLVDRVRRLETRRKVVVGDYVLEQDAGGNLTARHATTNTVTTLAVP